MKIQCDVCGAAEAVLFCTADEAAICGACDLRVHRANKLAGKHPRFSLLHPSSRQDAPRCDVCQERRAFLFCQEDRAILCRECDLPIHTANDHTRKHSRFLLTGVKLSPAAEVFPEAKKTSGATETGVAGPAAAAEPAVHSEGCTSSISEYLIETLPGWHVEEFLGSPSTDGYGLSKMDGDLFPDVGFSFGGVPAGVPQVPLFSPPPGFFMPEEQASSLKTGRRWALDVHAVPQISSQAKRARPFW